MEKAHWNSTSHQSSSLSYLVDSYSFIQMAKYKSLCKQAPTPLQKTGSTIAIGRVVVTTAYARTTTTIRQRVSRTGNAPNVLVAMSVVKFRMDMNHQRYALKRIG